MESTYEEAVLQIKDRIDIIEIISEEVILKKSGSNYWGLCPFHGEKSPSFSVNAQRGFFKCFGCGVGGDAITFLMKIRNLDYNEVIKSLAERYNIELPEKHFHSAKSKELKDKMGNACKKAAEFYSDVLLAETLSNPAKKYLDNRGIKEGVIKTFSLGLALKEPNLLYQELKKDFSDEILEKAGLVLKTAQGKFVDRFRNRIIIPIKDEHGDCVAFGARAIDEGQNPKYLNSSDSLIYNKSKLLYGLSTAKDAIKVEDSVIIMEGYFDVISAQMHGVKNCVASCGTSLTLEHIKLLSKYSRSRRIFLSFDTDVAGVNATKRGGELIKSAFQGLGNIKQFDESHISTNEDKYACEIRVVAPPDGKDPDEFIRSFGAESYKTYVENAPLLLDFQLEELLKKKSEIKTPLEKSHLIKEITLVLNEVQNQIIQSEYIKLVASVLEVDETALNKEVQKTLNQDGLVPIVTKTIVTKTSSIEEKAQKNLLSLYLISYSPFSFREISEKIGSVKFGKEKLIIVKDTIDKLIQTVNNVSELTNRLYTQFSEDKELQELLTDLICNSEAFNSLSPKDFQSVIDENVEKIKQFKRDAEVTELKTLYNSANDDETEALKIQIQLRDKINNELMTGDNK